MIVDDERDVLCGGSPLVYLKSLMKSLYFRLEPGQDAKILLLREKFPFGKEMLSKLATDVGARLISFDEKQGEIHIVIRKKYFEKD